MRTQDLTGLKFNRLSVINRAENGKNRAVRWNCICECGTKRTIRSLDLRTGRTKSCGCLTREVASLSGAKREHDLMGQRFSRLTVIGKAENKNGTRWVCKCDCGNITTVTRGNLREGQVRSCGCFSSERRTEIKKTHGLSRTPLYRVWSDMVNRCENVNNEKYKWYGERGICVIPEWRSDFVAFYNDMKDEYKKGLELDRIDNDGNYCKTNCRWATHKEQARNRRNKIWLTVDGETKRLIEWAESTGTKRYLIYGRMRKGWTDKEAVFGKTIA